MDLVCCCCGCISKHLYTGKDETIKDIVYMKYRCVDCDSIFFMFKENEKIITIDLLDNLKF